MVKTVHAHIVKSKAWYRSRGVWGAILGAIATLYGLWAGFLPCGGLETLHNTAASVLGLYGAYLAFAGRRTAYQPIHIFWPFEVEVVSDA